MATVTLVANTDYSALSLANDDTIDCAGFILTLDIQPTHTGIQVVSPGTNGTVVFSGSWVIPTWDFFTGTTNIIDTVPSGAEIGSITGVAGVFGILTNNGTVGTANGGSLSNSHGIFTNDGVVTTANGGSATFCYGININNGTVTIANGGSATSGHAVNTNNGTVTTANGSTTSSGRGVSTNNGTVVTANGGSANNAHGVNANIGTVTNANGGTASGAHGVNTNNGTVESATGGSNGSSYGVNTNNGLCLRLTDNTALAINDWRGGTCFVEGAHINGEIPDNLKTIYSLGPLSSNAIIAGDATVIEMGLAGGGGSPSLFRPRQGNLIGRSF